MIYSSLKPLNTVYALHLFTVKVNIANNNDSSASAPRQHKRRGHFKTKVALLDFPC